VACLGSGAKGVSPHFAQWETDRETGRRAVALSWSAAGSAVRVRPGTQVGLKGAKDLALRLIVPPNSTGTRLGVTVVGVDGRRTALGDVRADGLPGTQFTTSYWGQEVRVPWHGGKVAALELTPRTATGNAWLLDAWGWHAGTPNPQETALPRVDIGTLKVAEGNSGSKTYRLPVKVSGHGGGVVRLFLVDAQTGKIKSWLATVRPGDRTIPVPVTVVGDKLFGNDELTMLGAKAVRGFVIGDYQGGIEVRNDDPAPKVSVASAAVSTTEGGALTWRLSLSAPTESGYFVVTAPRPPASGTELSTTDVDPAWFQENTFEDVLPSRPLSSTSLTPYVSFDPGVTTATLTVPTIADHVAEPAEVISLHFVDPTGPPDLTGTVTD